MMADGLYSVGDRIRFQQGGRPAGMYEVKSITLDGDGKRQVHLEVSELVQGYSGPFKVGTPLRFPEDGIVGTSPME